MQIKSQKSNSEIPAGLLPEDCNIEIFANPKHFGKCLFVQYGTTKSFHELPLLVVSSLYQECFNDEKAVKAMEEMGIPPEDMVEFYNHCNRGALNGIPDIYQSGKMTREHYNCGRRGKCIGEGRVCKLDIAGTKFTPRELECIRLNSEGNDYDQIKSEMGFRSKTAVNSLMSRCRTKLHAKDRTELLIKSQQIGII